MNLSFEELIGANGAMVGIATLDAAKSLNALSLPMIEALHDKLDAWEHNPRITCVVVRGNGPKAFCAGGDVRSLVDACRAHPGEVPALAARFFEAEYRLDYRLHTYSRPVICWGHGYVLGGGMGLLQSAAIRIVTPTSRLAMPEVSIGLYPDVAAGWFYNRLPGKLGLFLALTGAQVNATDALDLGLADRLLRDDQQDALIDGLVQLNWQEDADLQLISLLRALEHEAHASRPAPSWLARRAAIDALLDVPGPVQAWKAIARWRDHADPALAQAAQNLVSGSPLTAHLVWHHLKRARRLSLAEVLRMEYGLSLNCCRHPEFSEGVRARLVDKDNTPHWHWPDVTAIPEAVINAHFSRAWEGEHPLADL
jgi:enoyl-CoA hydratase/carnithine racemase